jgi:hypothetical protein
VKPSLGIASAVLALLCSCHRGIENTEAIRQGVIDHLASRAGLDVGQMQIDITSVSFRKDEADATVSIRPKGSTSSGGGMQMNYTLERKDNRWVVKSRREAGSPHGAGGEAPAGGQLPQGHPPVPEPKPERK